MYNTEISRRLKNEIRKVSEREGRAVNTTNMPIKPVLNAYIPDLFIDGKNPRDQLKPKTPFTLLNKSETENKYDLYLNLPLFTSYKLFLHDAKC